MSENNYKDRLRRQLRVKETVVFLCGASVVACIILFVVFLYQDKIDAKTIMYLILIPICALLLMKPFKKNIKKEREMLKAYEDKEKADRKARMKGQNPTNKFNLGINRTASALLGETPKEDENKEGQKEEDDDPINKFKYKKKK